MVEENKAVGTGCRQIIAMFVVYYLRKYKTFKILYLCSKLPSWVEGVVQLLRQFHPDSQFYWLMQTEDVYENYCFLSIFLIL